MSDVDIAVNSRSRRSTAGRRMNALVGEALDNDETFWSHSTWKEDQNKHKTGDDESQSSADGSFNLNDEPKENQVDFFDSDFDDSESDESSGSDNEKSLLREERALKKSTTKIIGKEFAWSKKGATKKSVGKTKSRIIGTEHNAGLVLRFPSHVESSTSSGSIASQPPIPTSAITEPSKPVQVLSVKDVKSSVSTRGGGSLLRKKPSSVLKPKVEIVESAKKKPTRKRKFTQEELLIEAVNETVPDNEKWILGRKRLEALSNLNDKRRAERGRLGEQFKVSMRFHSRSGGCNTITFPEMDLVPKILQQKPQLKREESSISICSITGKKARYKDPLTGKFYHDSQAFRELRRRYHAGESSTMKEDVKPLLAPSLEQFLDNTKTEHNNRSSITYATKDNEFVPEVSVTVSSQTCSASSTPTLSIAESVPTLHHNDKF